MGDQRKDIDAAMTATASLTRPIVPVALGPRAALRAVDGDCPDLQIAWSAHELDRLTAELFGAKGKSTALAPYPAVSA